MRRIFQHGFGASSLSWFPAIHSLVHRLRAQAGLGHDAVGSGFTDRPKDRKWYTFKQSARIARQLLLENGVDGDSIDIAKSGGSNNKGLGKSVALYCHSMGALAILRLATALPKDSSTFIVLSSPALGFSTRPSRSARALSLSRHWIQGNAVHPIASLVQAKVLKPFVVYILCRVDGTKGYWKTGLKAVWGDPRSRVTELY